MKEYISTISENLIYKDEIWFSKEKSDISYPEDGNKLCYELEDQSFWFKHRAECIINAVSSNITDKKFFDIGGGNGYTSLRLMQNGIETILIEPGLEGVLNAKKRKLNNLICSTFQDAGFKENSIPNIGIFDVLEHVEKDIDFLKEINIVLKENGKLFITVPAFKVLWSNQDKSSGHHRRYTLSSLKAKLIKANFKIEYSSYFFSVLPIPIFLFRTIPSLFSRKKTENTNKIKNQHKKGLSLTLIKKLWEREILYIKKRKKIFFGSSCLVIAKKMTNDNS